MKGTELCLKPYAFFFIYKLIWLQTLHEIKLVCFFSPRDLELRTVCLYLFILFLFFFLLLVQHCKLGQHFPGFTAIFSPVGVLLLSQYFHSRTRLIPDAKHKGNIHTLAFKLNLLHEQQVHKEY